MTVENAVAIAGGFTPRAQRKTVTLSRHIDGIPTRGPVPNIAPVRPGDTIIVAGTLVLTPMPPHPGGSLNILHVFRAPVGGLFRHVVDLVRGQAARGHRVGVIADSTTGGERAETTLAALSQSLSLGLTRVPMSRQVGTSDVGAVRHVAARLADTKADVVHGHGAKGGAYARLTRGSAIRVYTPHGGSLHYGWNSPVGFLYLTARTRDDAPHRPVPVRKRVRARASLTARSANHPG